MTVPEEARPKTAKTDQIIDQQDEQDTTESTGGSATGRDLAEALDEADVRPEDMHE
ncbi:hypothetical protein [Streptomyces sp. NPDC047869]|uniref:hypothetical protein n=1 Tax=Streptomyces sp. NPDC047869 TaxID=3154709 RepID=UPI003455E641